MDANLQYELRKSSVLWSHQDKRRGQCIHYLNEMNSWANASSQLFFVYNCNVVKFDPEFDPGTGTIPNFNTGWRRIR